MEFVFVFKKKYKLMLLLKVYFFDRCIDKMYVIIKDVYLNYFVYGCVKLFNIYLF